MITIDRFLNNARLAQIIADLALAKEKKRPLRFLDRLEVVDATDDEMAGNFRGEVYAADIVALDQTSAVYESGAMEIVTTIIPKLKLGINIPESVIVKLQEMVNRGVTMREMEQADATEVMRAADLLIGIRQRANALACAMMLDDVVYDRFGVKIIGSFGMPADLKVLVPKAWSDVTAKGITDILALKTYAESTYGAMYDRLTLSQADFQDLVRQDEFKKLATALFPTAIASDAVNVGNLTGMKKLLGQLLGMDDQRPMTIEIEDATFREKRPDGKTRVRRVMPMHKVSLSSTDDDNDRRVMDLANGVIAEPIVAAIAGYGPESLLNMEAPYGPIGYYLPNPTFDPPHVTAYGVQRCFPRKHVREATASLTVG